MADAPRQPSPSRTPERRWTWLIAMLSAGVAFLLGWLTGREDPGREEAPGAATAAATASAKRPADVELRLDAGALTLMPDGGLELPPMPPLRLDGGAGGAAAEMP